MISTEQIRAWAMTLPEVSEKQHFRFKVPLWQVRGKTFLGMGHDETTAVFCISEAAAAAAVAADPELGAPVRRSDGNRSFLGLEVQLRGVASERAEALVIEAWGERAPKRLVSEYLG
ncbi:MAG: hypothetical protein ACTHKG_08460 [Nocardioides sp.]